MIRNMLAPPTARVRLPLAAALAGMVAAVLPQPAAAQLPRTEKFTSLNALLADGFEIKAAAGNQAGVVGTLVLQRGSEVYLCGSKEPTIQPLVFTCWPVK